MSIASTIAAIHRLAIIKLGLRIGNALHMYGHIPQLIAEYATDTCATRLALIADTADISGFVIVPLKIGRATVVVTLEDRAAVPWLMATVRAGIEYIALKEICLTSWWLLANSSDEAWREIIMMLTNELLDYQLDKDKNAWLATNAIAQMSRTIQLTAQN
jgi:hypothetical protein